MKPIATDPELLKRLIIATVSYGRPSAEVCAKSEAVLALSPPAEPEPERPIIRIDEFTLEDARRGINRMWRMYHGA